MGRMVGLAAGLAVVAGLAVAGAAAVVPPAPEVAIPEAAPYAPQAVVYHVTQGGGWFGRDHAARLGSMQNHIVAVGQARIHMAVVLQGQGVDLLADASRDPALAARVDALRAQGVRFLVCRNTLVSRRLPPAALHGLSPADVVGAAVAEVAAREQQGYVLIRL